MFEIQRRMTPFTHKKQSSTAMQATIKGHHLVDRQTIRIDRRLYVAYEIHCRVANNEWTVHRRYKDFLKLNNQLEKRLLPITKESLRLSKSLPRKYLTGNLQVHKIEQRQVELQRWLNVVVSHPETTKSKPFDDFFEVSINLRRLEDGFILRGQQQPSSTTTLANEEIKRLSERYF